MEELAFNWDIKLIWELNKLFLLITYPNAKMKVVNLTNKFNNASTCSFINNFTNINEWGRIIQ